MLGGMHSWCYRERRMLVVVLNMFTNNLRNRIFNNGNDEIYKLIIKIILLSISTSTFAAVTHFLLISCLPFQKPCMILSKKKTLSSVDAQTRMHSVCVKTHKMLEWQPCTLPMTGAMWMSASLIYVCELRVKGCGDTRGCGQLYGHDAAKRCIYW